MKKSKTVFEPLKIKPLLLRDRYEKRNPKASALGYHEVKKVLKDLNAVEVDMLDNLYDGDISTLAALTGQVYGLKQLENEGLKIDRKSISLIDGQVKEDFDGFSSANISIVTDILNMNIEKPSAGDSICNSAKRFHVASINLWISKCGHGFKQYRKLIKEFNCDGAVLTDLILKQGHKVYPKLVMQYVK